MLFVFYLSCLLLQETEKYISQLEGENKVPAGKELIRPTSGFVVKTHKGPGSKKASGTGDGEGEKMFLNIVQSEKINRPSSTTSDKGMHWSVPYSVGPVHMEVDKSGDLNVACFDICFHPEALGIAARSKQFKDLLVQTAIDGVELSYKQNLPQSTTVLNREKYHILKGVKYKSGDVIPTMMVDSSTKDEQWKSGKVPMPMPSPIPTTKDKKATPPAPAAAVKPIPAAKTGTNVVTNPKPVAKPNKPAIKKGFLNRAAEKEKQAMPFVTGNKKDGINKGAAPILTRDTSTESSVATSAGVIMSPHAPTGGSGSNLVKDVTGQTNSTKATTAPAVNTSSTTKNNDIGLSASSTTIRKRPNASAPTPADVISTTDSSVVDKTPHFVVSERGSQKHATQTFEAIDKQFVASNRSVHCICMMSKDIDLGTYLYLVVAILDLMIYGCMFLIYIH